MISWLCILLTGLVLISIFFIFKTLYESYENYDDKHIDIVISWVTSDDKFIEDKKKWLDKEPKKYKDMYNNYMFTDNQELKYCLRSIEKYFPYYNNIYLVTKDWQYPSYLKKYHPKLKVIKESDIMPKNCLPTFNSMSVEAYIHHIPNLTDNYLYLNDDFVFLKHTKPSLFLENGLPTNLYQYNERPKQFNEKYYSIDRDLYDYNSGYAFNNILLHKITGKEESRNTYTHVPKIFKKEFDFEIEKKLKKFNIDNDKINIYDKTGMSKFRKNDNLYLVGVVKDYLYKNWFGCKLKPVNSLIIYENTKLDEGLVRDKQFLCIQEVDKNKLNSYLNFMNKLFPYKSSFEM
jgi:hypothetical protein